MACWTSRDLLAGNVAGDVLAMFVCLELIKGAGGAFFDNGELATLHGLDLSDLLMDRVRAMWRTRASSPTNVSRSASSGPNLNVRQHPALRGLDGARLISRNFPAPFPEILIKRSYQHAPFGYGSLKAPNNTDLR